MERAASLPDAIRASIGLYTMGYTDPKVIASHVFRKRDRSSPDLFKKRVAFVMGVLVNRRGSDIIATCLKYGLPSGVLGAVWNPVRCPVCGQSIYAVPCVECYRPKWRDRAGGKPHEDDYCAEKPRRATNHRPGTPEKIAVMVRRVEAGESPFHPNDKPGLQPCSDYLAVPFGRTACHPVSVSEMYAARRDDRSHDRRC